MRAHHLPLLTTVSAPTVHSDYAVVAVTRPDFAADAYVGQLWRVPVDGRPARRITRGFVDTSPKLSPDGSLLAFLRGSAEAPPQLALVPADGGEPMVITDAELGVLPIDDTTLGQMKREKLAAKERLIRIYDANLH